ncbi:hypothetical protein Taro_023594, partial [Colocasia esculenta]|nr:hypothetical protein [Colocasia esculenta]
VTQRGRESRSSCLLLVLHGSHGELLKLPSSPSSVEVSDLAMTLRLPWSCILSLLHCCCCYLTAVPATVMEEYEREEQRQSLYSRFYISVRDIAAFFMDASIGSTTYSVAQAFVEQASLCPKDLKQFYSLIDRCGMSVVVDMGIGNTSAEWKPCFVLLSGLYLYVLESEVSQNYQRCTSMAGRQVFEVPPSSVGGSLFSLAVSCRGNDMQKALESSNTLIIEFQSDTEKAVWLRGLVQATYRASTPPDIDILGEVVHNESESCGAPTSNEGKVDLVINGALFETSLSIYGKLDRSRNVSEEIILELLAGGGKVNLVCSEADLIFKMKLHSLKVKDELQSRLSTLSMNPQYLACSVLMDNLDTATPCSRHADNRMSHSFPFEDDDIFKDALPDFVSTPDQALCAQYLDPCSDEPSSQERDRSKGKIVSDVFYETEDNGSSDFITLNFLTRNPDSPFYDGIDTQMTICMSKLDFFCNRPTLVALIEFGFDLSSMNSEVGNADNANVLQDITSQAREKAEESGSNVIKGLLGHGKGRVVFNLSMDVDSVCIFLNKEDGSRLALFVQENFLLDIEVHPNSLSIEGTLGNLRLCDLSLGQDHCWGWLCDLRNQGMESLIKFTFQSYSTADDDYEGYDYSLHGRLSAVRIIFLYRFVQEITSYFMELATPHTEEAVRFVDKVGDFEWLIQKYEIDGASAIKLDMSLDTPIIIVPRDSSSKDFLQLDLGQLHLCNSFSWHGCQDNDPSAVHLDILHIEVHGINMAVGINGLLGKPMIREAQGLNMYVRRSLRDVFRKVPTAYVEVRVALLHCLMSDKEYNVILDCAYMNISEEPKLPPSFRDAPKDPMRILADKVQINSQILLSRTVAVVVLEIQNALLDLHNCLDEESPLAHVALEGLWLSYRRTSLFETDIYLTIPKLSILDIRPDTKPEMCLMLGSSSDASRHGIFSYPSLNDDFARYAGPEADTDHPNLTMLIMDYHFRSSSQSLVIRIQQPRILAVLDFLLPVIEFFVPALGVVTGREETMHAQNDPLTKCDDIVLSESIYMQQSDALYLSPTRRLIVDGCGDEFIYDGCGGTIHLTDGSEFKTKSSVTQPPIILIGRGKKLRFKNVKFEIECGVNCQPTGGSFTEYKKNITVMGDARYVFFGLYISLWGLLHVILEPNSFQVKEGNLFIKSAASLSVEAKVQGRTVLQGGYVAEEIRQHKVNKTKYEEQVQRTRVQRKLQALANPTLRREISEEKGRTSATPTLP